MSIRKKLLNKKKRSEKQKQIEQGELLDGKDQEDQYYITNGLYDSSALKINALLLYFLQR